MKYIKTFESYENYDIPDVGDYVVVDPSVFKTNYYDVPQDWLPFDFPIGKIIASGASGADTIKYYTGFISHMHKILRKAPKEEIENYNIRIDAKKYNIV